MSAEVLRRAAALMRERAAGAQSSPWQAVEGASGGWWVEQPSTGDVALDVIGSNTAAHIASWHPAVALAVADWLEGVAARVAVKVAKGGNEKAAWSHELHALNVARAYLGESA